MNRTSFVHGHVTPTTLLVAMGVSIALITAYAGACFKNDAGTACPALSGQPGCEEHVQDTSTCYAAQTVANGVMNMSGYNADCSWRIYEYDDNLECVYHHTYINHRRCYEATGAACDTNGGPGGGES